MFYFNKCLFGRLRHDNTHMFDFQTFIASFFKSKSKTISIYKTLPKNCPRSFEDCEWNKRELELIFSPNQAYSIQHSVIKKHFTQQIVPCLFSQIYTIWWILIGFALAIFDAIFGFLESKEHTIPRWIFKTEGYLKQKLSKKV